MAQKNIFKIYETISGVNIRTQPSTTTDGVIVKRMMTAGEQVTAYGEPERHGDYYWIEHHEGWSAVRGVHNGKTYLKLVQEINANQFPDYQVSEPSVNIRNRPSIINTITTGSYTQGDRVITLGTPIKHGNHYWVQHKDGWSAVSDVDKTVHYLKPISTPSTQPATPEPIAKQPDTNPVPAQPPVTPPQDPSKTPDTLSKLIEFEVISTNGVRVRSDKTTSSDELLLLEEGTRITCEADYVQSGNYWWIKHNAGWSATGTLSNRNQYIQELGAIAEKAPTDKQEPQKPTEPKQSSETDTSTNKPEKATPSAPSGKKKMRVISSAPARVRREPSTQGDNLIHYLYPGQIVECTEEKIQGNYLWGKHRDGWTAIKSTDNTIYMEEVQAGDANDKAYLNGHRSLFTRLPVMLNETTAFQYFGNNMFAMRHENNYGYDNYSQGLHGGLDFINPNKNLDVVTVCESTYVRSYGTGNNKVVVLKANGYEIIYQHLTNIQTQKLENTKPIPIGTKIAETDASGAQHLHLEVRLYNTYILNPLLFFTQSLYDKIIDKFDSDSPNTHYKDDFPESTKNCFYCPEPTSRWATPLDQPTLQNGSKVILRPKRLVK